MIKEDISSHANRAITRYYRRFAAVILTVLMLLHCSATASARQGVWLQGPPHSGNSGVPPFTPPMPATPVLSNTPPSNDDFSNSIPITQYNTLYFAQTTYATKEPGEPNHSGNAGGNSVWWSWTAPSNGLVVVSTTVPGIVVLGYDSSSATEELLAVYTGDSISNLSLVVNNYFPDSHSASMLIKQVSFNATAGVTYSIATDGALTGFWNVDVQLSFFPVPSNDNFTNGISVSGPSFVVQGDNVAATREPGEPIPNDNPLGATVWWSWMAPYSSYVDLSPMGSSFATSLAVYTGSTISNLTPVAYGAYGAAAPFYASAGQTYQIAVDGYTNAGNWGQIALSLSPVVVAISSPAPLSVFVGPTNIPVQAFVSPAAGTTQRVDFYQDGNLLGSSTNAPYALIWSNVLAGNYNLTAQAIDSSGGTNVSSPLALIVYPANDDFASRVQVMGVNTVVAGSVANASLEPGETTFSGVSAGQTCWWTWKAPSNGILTLSIAGELLTPFVTVFSGDQLTNLTLLASNNYQHCFGSCGCQNAMRGSLTFHVAAGSDYQIAADNFLQTTFTPSFWNNSWGAPFTSPVGKLTMQFNFTPAPANDNFGNPKVLAGKLITISASNAGATRQAGEPDHGGNPGGSSIWYSWRAPISGSVTIGTNPPVIYGLPTSVSLGNGGDGSDDGSITIIGGGYDCMDNQYDTPLPPAFFPIFGIYTGAAVDHLTTLDGGSSATYDAVADQTYHIAFDGNLGTTGNIIFYVTQNPIPPNDDFAHAIFLHGNVRVTGYNVGATVERAEPNDGGRSVWWRWLCIHSGEVNVNLDGSDFPYTVSVYTGSTLSALKLVAQGSGSVSFNGKLGQSYCIAVGSDLGATGHIKMTVIGAPAGNKTW